MHEQEGIIYNMPLVGQHFEHFMTSIAKLYEKDSLGLVLDFWCPTDGAITGSGQMERLPHRQVRIYHQRAR